MIIFHSIRHVLHLFFRARRRVSIRSDSKLYISLKIKIILRAWMASITHRISKGQNTDPVGSP
jgi:hypothetical protein